MDMQNSEKKKKKISDPNLFAFLLAKWHVQKNNLSLFALINMQLRFLQPQYVKYKANNWNSSAVVKINKPNGYVREKRLHVQIYTN